jgi:hypothetical protein
MVEIDDAGKTIWCPMEYEHLPDFCYICGLIGHVEKGCSQKLRRGEELQFGKWLRWVPPRKLGSLSIQRSWSDSRGRRSFWSGGNDSRDGSRSEGKSWRKDSSNSQNSGKNTEKEEKEVTSLLKITDKVAKEVEKGEGRGVARGK